MKIENYNIDKLDIVRIYRYLEERLSILLINVKFSHSFIFNKIFRNKFSGSTKSIGTIGY